jgi:hypothetical protein
MGYIRSLSFYLCCLSLSVLVVGYSSQSFSESAGKSGGSILNTLSCHSRKSILSWNNYTNNGVRSHLFLALA